MSRLEEWFGPSDKWLQDIIWPIIGLPVMLVIAAVVLWILSMAAQPTP